jgi:predicted Zn-dependent peptidase
MPLTPASDATAFTTLDNGVRVLTIPLPQLQTASVSVFVRSGSAHESTRLNGIGHVIEHMVFKGTATRDARQLNLDAERLGAEVNAHTDKDHTAFHMRGLRADVPLFVRLLGDMVRNASFPEAEFEREREVLLHEFTEDEDDPMSTAFKLFDKACFGTHPLAQPVIGSRRNIARFTRADLVGQVQRQYTGANLVVAVAGDIDRDAVAREADACFGSMARGSKNLLTAPAWLGGQRAKSQAGSSQTHLVLGFPIPPLQADDPTAAVAAALLGEGMSSPLMERLREERGLVYYAACSADVFDGSGQFVVEASMAPERLDECLAETAGLIAAHAGRVKPVDLERARCQILVRRLRAQDNAARLLEEAALDLFAMGRVRPLAERAARIESVTADEVRQAFRRMLAAGPTVAVAGQVGRGVRHRVRAILDAHL